MTMLAAIYAGTVLGFAVGFITCAALCANREGRRAKTEGERDA